MKKLLLIMLLSCGQEEFGTRHNYESTNSPDKITDQSYSCSNYSTIKPKLDLLFIWDNSSGTIFINDETKRELTNTIGSLGINKMDYHIILAPLYSSNNTVYLISENLDGISNGPNLIRIPPDAAANALASFASMASGNKDTGFQRVYDLLTAHTTDGVFRRESNLTVVLMSNSDHDARTPNGNLDITANQNLLNTTYNRFKNFKNNYDLEQFRFMSMVGFSNCSGITKVGNNYKEMSSRMLSDAYTGSNYPTQYGDAPDSYDICSKNFPRIFDGLNSSLTEIISKHVYCYWPITQASTGSCPFDPNDIVSVTKSTGIALSKSATNGYEVMPTRQININTRCEPSNGEPYTGYVLKLNGSAKVTYPECLYVETSRSDYYGFIPLITKPIIDTVDLKINNQKIAECTGSCEGCNGWKYIGRFENKSITIKSPTDKSEPLCNVIKKTAYFLELCGSAIYSNSTKMDITYAPSAE